MSAALLLRGGAGAGAITGLKSLSLKATAASNFPHVGSVRSTHHGGAHGPKVALIGASGGKRLFTLCGSRTMNPFYE